MGDRRIRNTALHITLGLLSIVILFSINVLKTEFNILISHEFYSYNIIRIFVPLKRGKI